MIAYALGGQVDGIQLGGEADEWLPERFGDCRINWGRVDPTCDWQIQREVLTVLAGPVAEMVYRDDSMHPATFPPWQYDWLCAWKICGRVVADETHRRALIDRLLGDLTACIRTDACWAAIAALADELEAHESLQSDEVHDLIRFWLK